MSRPNKGVLEYMETYEIQGKFCQPRQNQWARKNGA